MVSLDEKRVLGCVYILPFDVGGYGAEVTMWARADMLDTGLDQHLFDSVKSWIAEEWPFDKVAYPGRDMPFVEYNDLRNLQAMSALGPKPDIQLILLLMTANDCDSFSTHS